MSFTKITEELLNKTLTENGDVTLKSTLSPCLDYFALCGGKRGKLDEVAPLFIKAYHEDPVTAVKLLFYTRDIRGGLGERVMFRFLVNYLANTNPEIATQIIKYIPEYGRYDDLLSLLNTPVETDVINFIHQQLLEDIANKENGKSISLLAKWMPSINTSNKEARQTALYLAKRLNMSNAEYRKTLSFLRRGLIIENNLREKDYTFDYDAVSGLAMQKYRGAFVKNDEVRFDEYLKDLANGKGKMNVNTMDVVSLVRNAYVAEDTESEFIETAWKQLTKDTGLNRRTLVVRDGSGSMTYSYVGNTAPLDIANAMTLLTAERLQGEFHNKFITFSSEPEFVDLTAFNSLKEKVSELYRYDDCSNTNIQKVYELILNVYKNKDFKPEDALEQILIVSDMEFDYLKNDDDSPEIISTYEYFDQEFKKLGFKRPQIIFWNVESRGTHLPVGKDEEGTLLISGQSKNIIDLVVNDDSYDPLVFMHKVLERYAFVDTLDWGK